MTVLYRKDQFRIAIAYVLPWASSEKAKLICFGAHKVLKSTVLQREAKGRGHKKWKRVLIVVAFQLRLSRYAFIIIRNGRRRVKSLNAPWLINFLWIFYYLRELSFHLPCLLPQSCLSPLASRIHPSLWPFVALLSKLAAKVPSNLTFFFRCGAKAKMHGIWSSPNSH